jgi:DNA-binding response OmpR family regulator
MSEEATVLLVDDDPDLVTLYETFLEGAYDVRTATGGSEALATVDDTVDVALLDRRMPEMTGDELLREIRNRGFDIRVAMLTAVDPDADIVDMSFDDYKVKPVVKSDLIGMVEVLLERAEYDDQSQRLFRLASKKAALEVADNDDTAEYERLTEQLREHREEIDATLDRVGAEDAFRDLSDD